MLGMTWGFIATTHTYKKNGQMTLPVIRKEIISMINYEKAKTMFFRISFQHADRHSSTIVMVERQYCGQH